MDRGPRALIDMYIGVGEHIITHRSHLGVGVPLYVATIALLVIRATTRKKFFVGSFAK